VLDWQCLSDAVLSRIISKKLASEKPGGWLPATVSLYLRRLRAEAVMQS
jgi:hypothetical protein